MLCYACGRQLDYRAWVYLSLNTTQVHMIVSSVGRRRVGVVALKYKTLKEGSCTIWYLSQNGVGRALLLALQLNELFTPYACRTL